MLAPKSVPQSSALTLTTMRSKSFGIGTAFCAVSVLATQHLNACTTSSALSCISTRCRTEIRGSSICLPMIPLPYLVGLRIEGCGSVGLERVFDWNARQSPDDRRRLGVQRTQRAFQRLPEHPSVSGWGALALAPRRH